MNTDQSTTAIAGVDVSKRLLDVAIHGSALMRQVANTAQGHAALVQWLSQHGVVRVGLEATGGYERPLVAALTEAGFAVVVHQPIEIRLFGRMKRARAKNDRLDAKLIACATAQIDALKAANDPRLVALAERLTAYEQAADVVAQLRTYLEHTTLPDLVAKLQAQIDQMVAFKRDLAKDLKRRITDDPELRQRFDLLQSLPGVGPIVAISLVIRMPELGTMARGQAAALLGVAPFDRDSGSAKGHRFIAGGRERPRRMVYIAALAAKRWDPEFKAFADRLLDKGKPAKIAIVAVMRKLIEAANVVLKRNQPWIIQHA